MEKDAEKKCGVCKIPCFERNNYFYGKLMTVRDFSAEQYYFNEKRWLINRMVNGWGVVCGLDVELKQGETDTVIVTPGLAIDCCGREILVCEAQEVRLVEEASECHKEKPIAEEEERNLFICLEFYECKTERMPLPPIACDQKDRCEFNRIRDSFKIRVRPESEAHGEIPYESYCPLFEDKPGNIDHYLCEKLKPGCPECPEKSCLVLAKITITPSSDPSSPPTIEIDQCSKRKLVYSNPVLYDLIDCFHGDLPHVIGVNWKKNGSHLKWEEWENGIYANGLKIKFDRKMNEKSINTNTFLVLVKMEDADTGNYRYEQVPGEVTYAYGESIATFVFTSKWLMDVYFGYSRIRARGGEFMVLLKSDFILCAEEKGKPAKALDGNFIGGIFPSGNGSQGGDFVSWFSVAPKPELSEGRKKQR